MASPVEDCFAREFEAYLPGYGTRRIGDGDLLARAKTALLEALRITEELPRSHWVWQPGYAVQTVNLQRLQDFCRFRLREDPSDELIQWVRIGLALRGHDTEFGGDAFRVLKDREGFDASWPVYAACLVQRAWMGSSAVRLGTFLRDLDLLQEASPTIDAIRRRQDPYIDVWDPEDFTRDLAAECLEVALSESAA